MRITKIRRKYFVHSRVCQLTILVSSTHSEEPMNKPGRLSIWSGVAVITLSGLIVGRADEGSISSESDQLAVEHPECLYFTGQPERYMDQGIQRRLRVGQSGQRLSAQTEDVARLLSYVPPDSRTYS